MAPYVTNSSRMFPIRGNSGATNGARLSHRHPGGRELKGSSARPSGVVLCPCSDLASGQAVAHPLALS